MQTIVVAVDFATNATHICDEAIDLARCMHARLVLLHVVALGEGVRPDTLIRLGPGEAAEPAARVLAEDARAHLEPLLRRLQVAGVEAELCLRQGGVVTAIRACAEESGARLIVIGSDIPLGLRRLFQGSVTEEVIHAAPCPVLVVRGDSAAPRLSAARQQVRVEADG